MSGCFRLWDHIGGLCGNFKRNVKHNRFKVQYCIKAAVLYCCMCRFYYYLSKFNHFFCLESSLCAFLFLFFLFTKEDESFLTQLSCTPCVCGVFPAYLDQQTANREIAFCRILCQTTATSLLFCFFLFVLQFANELICMFDITNVIMFVVRGPEEPVPYELWTSRPPEHLNLQVQV